MERRAGCGITIKQIHDKLEQQANNTLRARNLTSAQVWTLMELSFAEKKQLPLKELERRLHVAQSTAAGIVVRLEQKGFVESFGDPDDRRVKMLRITPEGEQCCQTARQDMDEAEERLLSPLTEDERKVFFDLLKKVAQPLL